MIRTLITVAAAGMAFAQAPVSFEVASIRLHTEPIRSIGIGIAGPRVTVTAMSVPDLVSWAYNVETYEVEGATGWSAGDHFDISAKAPGDGDPARDDVRKMVQSLLAERFQLRLRRETREMPVYALVVGKGGAKLTENSADGPMMTMKSPAPETEMTFTGAPLQMLVRQLRQPTGGDRPVLDKTGLTGRYDFVLKTRLDPASRSTTGPDGESFFTTIEEQLGLRLESQKAPLEILVIDRVERPSDN